MKLPKIGDTIRFEMKNQARDESIIMEGEVGSVSKIFGGRIHIKKRAICLDEFVIRLDSVK